MSAVITKKTGGQVRLRATKNSLPVTLDTEEHGRMRVTIRPNVWTPVPAEIYTFLKNRFDTPHYTPIPDIEANEKNPHAPGAEPIMTTEERDPGFFLEFRP